MELIYRILESQAFWTNFWTAASGFGGAILGAAISYYFQHRNEKLADAKRKRTLLFKYSVQVDTIFGYLVRINHSVLRKFENDPHRHIKMIPFHATAPDLESGDPALDLLHLLEAGDKKVVGLIMNIRDLYFSLIEIIRKRNEMYENELHPVILRHNILKRPEATRDNLLEWIGPALWDKMEGSTNILFSNVKYIMENYGPAKKEIHRVFERDFPKHELLDLMATGPVDPA